jgi:predicted hotdog family 3-hydroxylacyl-ACP dehydratase
MEPIAEPLEKLVPHRGKMLLLSKILSCEEKNNSLLASVDISRSSFFYDDTLNGVPVWVGFEYMAQAIAALNGKNDLAKEQEPGFGFILSVSNFIANTPCFKQNSTLLVYVEETFEFDNIFMFNCTIKQDEEELAKASISAVKIKDVSEVKYEGY